MELLLKKLIYLGIYLVENVLVLVGKKGITTPVWASEMIHEWLPQSELVILPDAGHLIILDHPIEFNNQVISFWAK